MRRVLISIAAVLGLFVAAFGALALFPQISEKIIEVTCSMTDPDQGCRRRMVAMGHTWSIKGEFERAREWYARVADLGEPDAMFHLAWAYQMAAYGDLKQSLRDFKNSGNDDPSDRVRNALRSGNFKNAATWYRNAAEIGFAPAMNNLGDLAASGLLGNQDMQEAFAWYLAAARAGNPVGAMNVALAYRIGQGVARDEAEAQQWANFVPAIDSPDLRDFTLARTTLHGSNLEAPVRSSIRNAAAEHKAIAVTYEPMKPNARIPTFHEVSRELNPTPKRPTLKDLQR
jgi:Sel1 repeat-containing protein